MHLSTSNSERLLFNRGFGITLLALFVATEILLRLAPTLSPQAFRFIYGNALSMYMSVAERLADAAPEIEVLALGDSLTMTQFQPDVFAEELGVPNERVFNAGYSAMSFTSQERLLRKIGLDRFERLRTVLFFLNPHRVAGQETPNSEVFRVAIGNPDGPWQTIKETKKLAPLFDYSRVYGLSRYLILNAWRMILIHEPTWDDFRLLSPQGGVAWMERRQDAAAPVYPYPRIRVVSPERLAEMRMVIELFRRRGVDVIVLPNALHPEIQVFASPNVEARFHVQVGDIAAATGSHYRPEALIGFSAPMDTDFCDYGHMNRSGALALTRWLSHTVTGPES